MLEAISLEDLIAHIDPHTTLLTPNRRLAATLLLHYQEAKLSSSMECWATPDILPFTTWTERLWNDYNSLSDADSIPLLLSSIQENYLWEKVIAASSFSETLLRTSETAELAHSAWKMLQEWNVSLAELKSSGSDDYLAMATWATEFEQHCKKNSWISHSNILTTINLSTIALPQKLVLVGFNEFTPCQQLFLKRCEERGSSIRMVTIKQDDTNAVRVCFEQEEDEITTLALWAKEQFLKDKTKRVACVIPNLAQVRDYVEDIFTDIFSATNAAESTQSFNISAGKSLIQYPLIQTAMNILKLNQRTIPLEAFQHLITSAFIGDAEIEYIARARLLSDFQKNNHHTVRLDSSDQDLINKRTPKLSKRLHQLHEYINSIKYQQTWAEWSVTFNHLLKLMGWPGERTVNSEEYQIIEQWLNLFNAFSTLDTVSTLATYAHALHYLHRMVTTTVFQPQSPKANIQVLGILEAAAIPFDAVWLAGLNDLNWPPKSNPNPFIPKKLQRELAMPHATAARELQYCQQLSQQFSECAKTLIISHATHIDELELQPSALFQAIPEMSVENLSLPPLADKYRNIFQNKKIEYLSDNKAPAVESSDLIRGGVSILKNQALCPFKAFSESRLHAREMDSSEPGLRAQDRGSLIHQALEFFWKKVNSHANLCALSSEALNADIADAIQQAVSSSAFIQDKTANYITLEKKRTHQLINNWLNLEKLRPPFIVKQQETSTAVTIGKLALSIRIDRVDALIDGKELIIDYKTGKNNNIYDWLGTRLEEPQLPLYALINPATTCAITYAELAAGHLSFKGISQYAINIDGVTPVQETRQFFANSWEELITDWQHILMQLSDDFTGGNAIVDPKDPPSTCVWCALKPLCRINEEEQIHHVA